MSLSDNDKKGCGNNNSNNDRCQSAYATAYYYSNNNDDNKDNNHNNNNNTHLYNITTATAALFRDLHLAAGYHHLATTHYLLFSIPRTQGHLFPEWRGGPFVVEHEEVLGNNPVHPHPDPHPQKQQ